MSSDKAAPAQRNLSPSRRLVLGAGLIGVPALGLLGFAAETGRIDLLTPTLPEKADLPPVAGMDLPPVTRAAFAEGPTLLNVWGSWCPQCREEHATLLELSKRPGIRLFGLAINDSAASVAAYLKEAGNPYTRLSLDAGNLFMRGLKQRGVPSTFVFRQDGSFVAKVGRELTPALVETKLLPAYEAAHKAA